MTVFILKKSYAKIFLFTTFYISFSFTYQNETIKEKWKIEKFIDDIRFTEQYCGINVFSKLCLTNDGYVSKNKKSFNSDMLGEFFFFFCEVQMLLGNLKVV